LNKALIVVLPTEKFKEIALSSPLDNIEIKGYNFFIGITAKGATKYD
jgi:hypothetical protein